MSAEDERLRALWAMVDARASSPLRSERESIDREIWDRFGDERAVIFTDLSGFSRRVAEFGIVHFLQIIAAQKRLLTPVIERFGGTLIKAEGDSLLVTIPGAAAGVRAAIAMQQVCAVHDAEKMPEDRVLLCVGVGFGRVLRIGDIDVFGQEVNAASKLGEDTARSGEILVTGSARDAAGEIEGARWEEIDCVVAGSDRNFRLHYPPSSPT